ncbi:hypothetical protein FRC02_005699 [Tulasnella sp. 418]|nr:hypothetical protein FRC02_005699 [Tulasnella sp. 418]
MKEKRSLTNKCIGIYIELPEGHSPYGSYPFGMHDVHAIPWDLHITRDRLSIQSIECEKRKSRDVEACHPCTILSLHPILTGILDRMNVGVHENTPHQYQPIAGLRQIISRKTQVIDQHRLIKLSDNCKILGRANALEDHKKFVMAIGSGRVQHVHALVRVALRNKRGIRGILELIDKAAKGLYKPKDYQEEEILRGIMFLKFGGNRVAQFAHRAIGLPSVTNLRRNLLIQPLRPSVSLPSILDIEKNIDTCYPYEDSGSNRDRQGLVMMIDEVKCESRIRWDPVTNKILGLCREHSHTVPSDFNSLEDAELVCDEIEKGEVHFAVEATVIAIGAISSETRTYASCPIALSGTCKREDAMTHSVLLQNAIRAIRNRSHLINGRLYCIASDGES